MPVVNLPTIDINQDDFQSQETMNQILDTLQKYRKELNFLLMNLDGDNMPSVIGRIEDGEGNISLINQTLESINATVANNQGDIANLQIMANSISATVANNAGDISQLELRADSISSAVANNRGDISSLQQTATSIQSTISSHTGEISSIKQTATNIQAQVTNNKNSISSLKQTATSIESDIISIDDQLGTHWSNIRQLSNSISSKVSYADYNGREIVSLIEQTASSVKISADKIDLYGITSIYSDTSEATFDRYGDFYITYGRNDIFKIYNHISGITLSSHGNAFLATGAYDGGMVFPEGTWDFSYADVEGLDTDVDTRYLIECYYRANKCYIDYGGRDRLTIRDSGGRLIGYVDIY